MTLREQLLKLCVVELAYHAKGRAIASSDILLRGDLRDVGFMQIPNTCLPIFQGFAFLCRDRPVSQNYDRPVIEDACVKRKREGIAPVRQTVSVSNVAWHVWQKIEDLQDAAAATCRQTKRPYHTALEIHQPFYWRLAAGVHTSTDLYARLTLHASKSRKHEVDRCRLEVLFRRVQGSDSTT